MGSRVTGAITQFQETRGMRDEALGAGEEALDTTREFGGDVRAGIEDRRHERLSKRVDRLSQKRAEREQDEGLEK